jgi:hypothetical protein
MTIRYGIQVIMVLPQQFERPQCWYHRWDGFMEYAVQMTSGVIIHISRFMKIVSSNIEIITSTTLGAALLVLLTGGIYEVRH